MCFHVKLVPLFFDGSCANITAVPDHCTIFTQKAGSESLLIQITETLFIDDEDLQLDFIRSSGPGGQNVNKVCTAVQLRYDVAQSKALSDELRQRLIKIAGNRMTERGVLVIKARRFRSQDKNRKDAFQRLVDLIRRATVRPKARRKTKPAPAANERRLLTKKKRSETTRRRRVVRLTSEP